MRDWYKDDAMWQRLGPLLFDWKRLTATVEETDGILSLADIVPPGPVLDLGCGLGRHSLELARRGYRVTGIDRTRDYLECARQSAAREELSVEWVQGDMTRFERPSHYRLALNLYTTFGYGTQEDDVRMLGNIARSLQPGGAFVMELMTRRTVSKDFASSDWHKLDDVFYVRENILAPDRSHIEMRWTVAGPRETDHFTVRIRLYRGMDLVTMLRQAGFDEVHTFGNLHKAPYDQDAEILVLLARR